MIWVCLWCKLTCTEPGNVPGQNCAGPWAAGTGSGQDAAPPQLHRDPAERKGSSLFWGKGGNNSVVILGKI